MNKNTNFGTNVLIAVGISYTGYAASFISSILIARLLGPDGKGIFSLFMETSFGIVLLASMGIGNGQIYEVSRNPGDIKHFMPNAFVFAFTLGSGIALLYYLIGYYLNFRVVAVLNKFDIALGVLVIPLLTIIIFQRQYFLALHSYNLAKTNGAMTMLLPMFLYCLLYVLKLVSVSYLIMAFVLGQALCFFIFQFMVKKSSAKNEGFSFSLAKKSLAFGVWQYLSDLSSFLIRRLDYFLLIWILGKSSLGIYSVAVALAEITSRLTHEIGTILFPEFASNNIPQGRAAPLLRKILFTMILIAIILALVSKPLITVLFGHRFLESIRVFQILLLGTIALSTIDVTYNYAAAHGQVKIGIPIFGIGVILDLILNLILLPRYGVLGAGISATISYWLSGILFLIVFCKKENCSLKEAIAIQKSDIKSLIITVRELPRVVFKSSTYLR